VDDIPLVVDDQDRGGHQLITLWLHLTASAAKHSMGEPPRPAFATTLILPGPERKDDSPS